MRPHRMWMISIPACVIACAAMAQEVMEFKPIPPESVSSYERRGSTPTPPEPAEPSTERRRSSRRSGKTELSVGRSGNVMRVGSDIHVAADQVVDGDLLAVGGDVTVDGHVEGDVVAMGGDIELNASARVDGDVVCMGGELREAPGATVGGQRVSGMGTRRSKEWTREVTEHQVRHASKAGASIVWLLILLAVAYGFARFAPGHTAAAVHTLKHETALSLGIGALIFALVIPSIVALALVVAILCITIIGIPIALAALLGYVLFLWVLWAWGYATSAVVVGEWVLRRFGRASSAVPASEGGVPPASLGRKAVRGVLVLGGIGLVGELLKGMWFLPLHGLGVFLSVISIVASAFASAIGAGAWLRAEMVSGTFARWWRGVPFRPGSQPVTSPPAPGPPPPPAADVPAPGGPA